MHNLPPKNYIFLKIANNKKDFAELANAFQEVLFEKNEADFAG